MQTKLTRRQAIGAMSVWATAPFSFVSSAGVSSVWAAEESRDGQNRSAPGYRLKYTYPLDELIGDLLHGERGDPERESNIPHREWYSHETRRRLEAWGPEQRLYEPLAELADRPLAWRRERVIATAARFIGYEYQHHHIPDWNPPSDWPWKPCCAGRNGRGVDCSNFTSFVYNQGFGIKMNAAIEHQAELREAMEKNEGWISVRRIELPSEYSERSKILRTGDLLYIRGREDGPVTHVVIWVGAIGIASSGIPLLLDSHGGNVEDDSGRLIPCGIHLRPFREDSWYNRCASHAHRIFGEA
ncbi:MAG TPA: NlpC/P60 family protein [Pirellulales bacterium]